MSALPQTRNAPRRRGMCPGVLAPMEVGDGLLVRVRVPAGVLPAASAKRIAELGGASATVWWTSAIAAICNCAASPPRTWRR